MGSFPDSPLLGFKLAKADVQAKTKPGGSSREHVGHSSTRYCSLIAAVGCQNTEALVSKIGRSPGDHGAARSMMMLKSSDEI